MVLAYLSRGDYFGEIGLLGGGVRTAMCTALDHVEVVRIAGDDFSQMVERFPAVRKGLEAVANEQRLKTVYSLPLDQFLSQALWKRRVCWCSIYRNARAATPASTLARTPTMASLVWSAMVCGSSNI